MSLKVAVVGGGVVGTSIAYHLGMLGERGVALFERGRIGSGTTGRAVGGLRTLFGHRLEAELSLYSLDAYLRLEQTSGRSFGFRRCGYLLLASSHERAEALSRAAANAAALGIPVEELSKAQMIHVAPGLGLDGVRKVLLSPSDGCLMQPVAPARAYAEMATRYGVTVMERTSVSRIRRAAGGFELSYEGQTSHAEQIIIAANAFAGPLLEDLDVRLPSYPYPRHVFSLAPAPPDLSPAMPIVVYQDEDLMLRHDGQIVVLICGLRERSAMVPNVTPEALEIVRDRVIRRVGAEGAAVSPLWSGIRAMTPDRRALIGAVPDVPGAWCAIGFSGHGIMHAPAVGLAVAEWLRTGRPQPFDLSPLAPDRLGVPAGTAPMLEPGHR